MATLTHNGAYPITAEQRLALLRRAARTADADWNLQTGEILCSPEWLAMLGLDGAADVSFDQARWDALCHPDDLPACHAARRRLEDTGADDCLMSLRMRHPDGCWRHIEVRGVVATRGAAGRPEWMCCLLFDRSSHRAEQQRWRAQADLSVDWYWQSDEQHRISHFEPGPRWQAPIDPMGFIGRRRDEVEVMCPPAGGWDEFHAMLDRRQPFDGVTYRRHAEQGADMWVEIDGRARFDPAGRFLGYEGVGRDVTARQRVAEALRRSLELVDALFEAIPVPVVQKDLQGRYTRVNQAFCEHFRIARSEVLGHTAARVLPDEAAQRHMRIDAELLERGSGTVQYDIRQRMADGRQADALVTKAVLNGPQGEAIGLVCTVVDISAIKQVERDLAEAKEAAEAASAAKTVFLSTMSHEIRTPINGVLGMAELLARRSSDAEQQHMVQVILESGRGLLRVIDDVLDFSKIEAGKLLFEPEGVELEGLVDGVCDALEPLAARQFVYLRPFVSPLIDHEVEVDRLRLRQILFNLVGNAIKFGAGRSGAPLDVRVRIWPEPGLIRLSVSDQGVGMDAATLGALFTPFTQADASTTRRFGGTGLGLAICKRLIEAQGGRIEVRSALGQGACFDVALPLSARAPRMQEGLPPLDGAQVIVWGPSDAGALSHAEDLHAWLAHAGASVRRIASLAELGHARGSAPRPAVVVWAGANAAVPMGLPHEGVHLISLASQGNGLEACAGSTVPRWRRRAVLQAVADALGRIGAVFADPPDSDASLPRASRPVRVLVAEDDPVNQLVIQSQLAVMGHDAVVAADGEQAWDLWCEGNFGLLLTDLHMPVLDGFELARRIRAAELRRGGLDRLPIIALTASALRSEARRARLAGIDQCLTKPVQVSGLQAALQSWLPSEPETGPASGLSA